MVSPQCSWRTFWKDEEWKSAQYSRLFRLQSAHTLLHSSLRSDLMVCWVWAARSAAGLGARLDMFGFFQRVNDSSLLSQNSACGLLLKDGES
jgi:hypothetical protein